MRTAEAVRTSYLDSLTYRCLRAEMLLSQNREEEAGREYKEIATSPTVNAAAVHGAAMFY